MGDITAINLKSTFRHWFASTFCQILRQPAWFTEIWSCQLFFSRFKTHLTVFIYHYFTCRMVNYAGWGSYAFRNWTCVVKLRLINACNTLILVNHFAQLETIITSQTVSNLRTWTLFTSRMTLYTSIDLIYCCGVVSICTSETISWEIKEVTTFCTLRSLSKLRILTLLTIFRTLKLYHINTCNAKIIFIPWCL